MLRALALLLTCVYTLSAQDRVSPEMMYHRVWAVVPLIGKGTADDPKRPMFVPSPAEDRARVEAIKQEFLRTGQRPEIEPPAILSFTMQLSDDGKSALVEFVGLNPEKLAFIAESRESGVKAFERGKATKQEIETEFRKVKANFNLDSLQGRGVAQEAGK